MRKHASEKNFPFFDKKNIFFSNNNNILLTHTYKRGNRVEWMDERGIPGSPSSLFCVYKEKYCKFIVSCVVPFISYISHQIL